MTRSIFIPPHALILLGMHRSGTSTLVDVLAKAAARDNLQRIWEHPDIASLHDRVLRSLGSAWDAIEPLEEKWWEKSFLSKFRHDLKTILARDFANVSYWGLRDPRLCRLLPLWQSVLEQTGCRARYVLILRHPLEVAQSLSVRNGMPEIRASLSWLEHTLAAERHTRGLPRVWLRYEDLLLDWRQALAPLLADPDWGLHVTPDIEREIDDFLDQDLRHHQIGKIHSSVSFPLQLAQEIYENLPALMRDGRVEEGFISSAQQLEQYRHDMAPWFDCMRCDSMNSRRELDTLQREINEKAADVARIKSSLTWKMGMPLRLFQNLMRSPQQTLREVIGRSGVSPHVHEPGSSLGKLLGEKTFAAPLLIKVEMPPSTEFLDSFELPCPSTPVVSIIIPVFNQLKLTLECLASLTHVTAKSSFEVIVMDDASHDETPRVLPRLRGLRYFRNPSNLGYSVSCNRAASVALGSYLVLLNNDTQVQPGWLDALLGVFEKHLDTGIAGPKLLNTDGSLQEAGAELNELAYATLRGDGDSPDAVAYNTFQEVTYVSGACLMIKTSVFRGLGGFDEVYSPAYYEDSDLAMRVRHAGHHIYYQPESVIVHHRNATTKHIPVTMANLVLRNRLIFLARWGDELSMNKMGSK